MSNDVKVIKGTKLILLIQQINVLNLFKASKKVTEVNGRRSGVFKFSFEAFECWTAFYWLRVVSANWTDALTLEFF